MAATHSKQPRIDFEAQRVNALLDKLQASGLAIGDRAAVAHYLTSHLDMLDLTEAVCATAQASVRPDDELMLDVYDDPEADDRTLQLYVRRSEYDVSIGPLLSSIVEQHAPAYKGKSGWLGVTTDFRSPTSAHAV